MEERKECIFDKIAIRRDLFRKRNEVLDKLIASRRISDKVLPLVRGNVSVYISIGSEVNTEYLIEKLLQRHDVTVFVPYTDAENNIIQRRLKTFGRADKLGNLAEECYLDHGSNEKIDFCITPLVGINDKGYRLGYGKGCYDRYFAAHETYKIGLAFDEQLAEFPEEAHDMPLDCCVTPSKVLYFKA